MKKISLFAALLTSAFSISAQNQWLHIFQSNYKVSTGLIEEVSEIKHVSSAACDSLFDRLVVERNGKTETFSMNSVDSVVIGTNVPTIYIDIENGAEVVIKDNYLNATVSVNGWGEYDDFESTAVTIKGRGNSTWNMDKKPYRLKFSKKQSICGMTKAKNYVLLANYIDCTLMRNSFALKLAQLLGLEYTNHFIPVNLVMNGTYRGSYLLTEKIGINGASVDIDETEGILFELDTNYDEPYRFHSNKFSVPVMVKDPDFDELAEDDPSMTANQRFQIWKAEFHALENTLSIYGEPSSDFANQMDIESLAKYMLVFNVCCNREPNHPKSVYLYKERTGVPFKMGPVWDFDWAFTFDGHEGVAGYDRYLFGSNTVGSNFFKAMLRSSEFKQEYEAQWTKFKAEIWPEMLKFMEEYSNLIRVTAAQNGVIWYSGRYDSKYNLGSTDKFPENYQTLVKWLTNRVNWLDKATNLGLYQY